MPIRARPGRRGRRIGRSPRLRRERGFALLLVLFTIPMLALLAIRLTASGRTEIQISQNRRAGAIAELAADGGVHEAMFRLLDRSDAGWPADGNVRHIRIGEAIVAIRIENLAGRMNPNTAPAGLMAALLARIGLPPADAASLAAAIVDWRMPGQIASPNGAKAPQYRAAGRSYGPPGRPFESLDEMLAVLGMTPSLLEAMRPYLSVHNAGPIDPLVASPAVRASVADLGINQLAAQGWGAAYEIEAVATIAGAGRFARRGVIVSSPAGAARPFHVLTWDAVSE